MREIEPGEERRAGGGINVLNGNKTNVSAILPISLKNTNILSGILGGGRSHGCGCN